MSDDEVIGFEITEDDINNEFNFDLRRPRISKNRATYGIWAEDSDEEEENDSRPTFGVSTKGRKINARGNYTAPVGFVSAGLQKSRKEELEEDKSKKTDPENRNDDLGDDGSDSEGEGTYSSGLGFNAKSGRRGFGAKTASRKLAPHPADSGQMAGFRTQGYQPPSSLGKGFGDWEKHTRGIGAKLLLKMGYQAGKGLGKELQGRSSIVEAHLRKGRGAIGAYGREGGMKNVKKVDSEEEEEAEFKEKLHQWKRGDSSKTKVKYIYKSADQVLEEGKWRKVSTETAGNFSKVKVIDMTGKEQRILSGYHAIANQKMFPDEDVESKDKKVASFDLPELKHNIDMLLDQCEENLISADRKLRHQRDKLVMLEREEEKLSPLLDREKSEIEMVERVLAAVEEIERLHQSNQLDLYIAKAKFSHLKEQYPKEYKIYELPFIASTVVVPLLSMEMAKWTVLDEPRRFREEFSQWRDLLEVYPSSFSKGQQKDMDPFNMLLWEAFMPRIRTAIGDWNSRHPDSIIQVLDSWNDLLPLWMITNIQDSIILPKLQKEVELWNPLTDRVPIHSWLHPWLPRLGQQLEIIYPTIRNKLSSALNSWHPSDKSARLILLPWKDVFTKGSMSAFVLKNILPKVEAALKEMPINPHHQRLDEWNWLMEWKEFLAPAAIVPVLEKHFFPRWLQVLAGWLNHNPNYDDVVKWYKGWKSVFPSDLLSTPHVMSQLTQALNMMNRVVSFSSGHPMSQQPGAVEAMAYLTAIEKESMPSIPPPQPPISKSILQPPPPSSMSDIPTNEAMGIRDMIAMKCAQRGIMFVPVIPQKFFEGKPIYRLGNSQVYLDRNAIFIFKGDCWLPVSLNVLLDSC